MSNSEEDKSEGPLSPTFVLSLVSLVVAAIALVVSVWQSNRATGQAEQLAAIQDQASRYASVMQANLDMGRLLVDNPRISPCFREGECPRSMTRSEARKSEDVGYMILDTYQFIHAQMGNLGDRPDSGEFVLRGNPSEVDYPNWLSWSHAMKDGFRYGPMLCELLAATRDSYDPTFVAAVSRAGWCSSLD